MEEVTERATWGIPITVREKSREVEEGVPYNIVVAAFLLGEKQKYVSFSVQVWV